MMALIGFSVYQDPVTLGIGLALFTAGVPIYFITKYLRNQKTAIRIMST